MQIIYAMLVLYICMGSGNLIATDTACSKGKCTDKTVEVLYGLFVLNAEVSRLSQSIEYSVNESKIALENHTESISASVVTSINCLMQMIKNSWRELKDLKATILTLQSDIAAENDLFYQQSKAQYEELKNRVDQLTGNLHDESVRLLQIINHYIDEAQVVISGRQRIMIEAINEIISHIPNSFDLKDKNDFDVKRLYLIDSEQKEECFRQTLHCIEGMQQFIKDHHDSSNEKRLIYLQQSIEALHNTWFLITDTTVDGRSQAYLELVARLTEQEFLLQRVYKTMQVAEQQLLTLSAVTEQEYSIQVSMLISDLEHQLKDAFALAEVNSADAVRNQCAAVCRQIYTMQTLLIDYCNTLKSNMIGAFQLGDKDIPILGSHITSRSQQLYNEIQEIQRNIMHTTIEEQSLLQKLNANIVSDIIQEISNANMYIHTNTNDTISALLQAKTSLSADITSKISTLEMNMTVAYNTLYSKVHAIDLNINNDIVTGTIDINQHILASTVNRDDQIGELLATIIGDTLTSISNAQIGLSIQHDMLCSKIAVAQVDLTAAAEQFDTHTCDMTEQHAEICKKLSGSEKRIVQEASIANANISLTGSQLIKEISAFAVRIAGLINQSTAARRQAIEYVIRLLTEKYMKVPIPI